MSGLESGSENLKKRRSDLKNRKASLPDRSSRMPISAFRGANSGSASSTNPPHREGRASYERIWIRFCKDHTFGEDSYPSHPSAMDGLEEFHDPERISQRLAFHRKAIAEEQDARNICAAVFIGPSQGWGNALRGVEGSPTAGMVTILIQRE